MTDIGLMYRFEEAAGSDRNRLLVLLEGLTSLPMKQLRHLTIGAAADLFKALPAHTSHRHRIEAVFREYVRRMKEQDPSTNRGSLLFPAHGARTKGFAPSNEPLSRVQVWRVLKAALVTALKAPVQGCLRALRALLSAVQPTTVPVPQAVVTAAPDWLDALVPGPPDGWSTA